MKVRVMNAPKKLSDKLTVCRVGHSWKAFGPDEEAIAFNGYVTKFMELKMFNEHAAQLLNAQERDMLDINVSSIRTTPVKFVKRDGTQVDEDQIVIMGEFTPGAATAPSGESIDAKASYDPRPSAMFGKK